MAGFRLEFHHTPLQNSEPVLRLVGDSTTFNVLPQAASRLLHDRECTTFTNLYGCFMSALHLFTRHPQCQSCLPCTYPTRLITGVSACGPGQKTRQDSAKLYTYTAYGAILCHRIWTLTGQNTDTFFNVRSCRGEQLSFSSDI